MRAKSVNEAQNFERGRDPKKSIGIGGVDLYDQYEETINDLKMGLSHLKLTTDEEWEEHLRKILVGKTITAHMKKLPSFDDKTGKTTSKYENREFTITINDAKPAHNISELISKHVQINPDIILADEKNNIYQITIRDGEKIYFE